MTLIVVSGPPASGKSTLAGALSRTLGCPLISRDEIREGVVLAGTPDPGMRHTYQVFTATVTTLATAGVTIVAEAAFQDHLWRPILTPLLPHVPVRVIHCRVTPAVAVSRLAARPAHGRAAHRGTPVAADAWVPIALEVPILLVDTTHGYAPAEEEIVAFAAERGQPADGDP